MSEVPKGVETAAIIYDFDGTLASGNLPEHSLLPALEIEPAEFWSKVKAEAKLRDADEILTYMHCLLARAREKGFQLTRQALERHGSGIPLFPGVEGWFDRINDYGRNKGLKIEHYIISSGLLEIIEGCSIYKRFKKVFACAYTYDESGVASWPASAINYTNKTQFLFRINKGIDNTWDNSAINRWQRRSERHVPFSRMVFLGDGDTDIPSMKMVRYQGGQAIAVFDPKAWAKEAAKGKLEQLIAEDRVDYVASGDYSQGSVLDVTVRGILGRMALKPDPLLPRTEGR